MREGRSDLGDTTAYLLMWEMPDYHGSCAWNKQKGRITANCGWKVVTSVYIWSPIPHCLSRLDNDRIGINKAKMVHANFKNGPWKLCNGLVVKALDYQSRGPRVQNHWVASRSTQPFILLRSIKWVPGISGNWMVKSKLPPRSGCSLEAVEPNP